MHVPETPTSTPHSKFLAERAGANPRNAPAHTLPPRDCPQQHPLITRHSSHSLCKSDLVPALVNGNYSATLMAIPMIVASNYLTIDTGAELNLLSESAYLTLQVVLKLPLPL